MTHLGQNSGVFQVFDRFFDKIYGYQDQGILSIRVISRKTGFTYNECMISG